MLFRFKSNPFYIGGLIVWFKIGAVGNLDLNTFMGGTKSWIPVGEQEQVE